MKKTKRFGLRILLTAIVLSIGISQTALPANAASTTVTPVKKTILINNMMCDGCVRWVAHALGAIDGVQVNQVTIGNAAVTLTKDVSDDTIKNAIQPVKDKGYSITGIITVPADAAEFNGVLGENGETGDPTTFALQKSQTDYGIEVPDGSGYKFYPFDTNGQKIASSIVATAAKLNGRNTNISVNVLGKLEGDTLNVFSATYTFHLAPPSITVAENGSAVVLKFADEAWRSALETVRVNSAVLDFKTKQYVSAAGAITIPSGLFSNPTNTILVSALGYNNVQATYRRTYRSDTGARVSVDFGKSYQFKITSLNGKVPVFVVAGKAFQTTLNRVSGKDYYYKVKASGLDGDTVGVYINGEKSPSTVLTVTNKLKSDTGAKLAVKAGKTYQFKITASTKPEFVSGNSAVFQTVYAGQEGNHYYFKVNAIGKAGQSAGIYINRSKKPYTVAAVA